MPSWRQNRIPQPYCKLVTDVVRPEATRAWEGVAARTERATASVVGTGAVHGAWGRHGLGEGGGYT